MFSPRLNTEWLFAKTHAIFLTVLVVHATPAFGEADLLGEAPANVPPVREVRETFFGQSVSDPYRYMENTQLPEVQSFMHTEAARARSTLDALPGRAALQARIEALAQTGIQISGVQLTGKDATLRVFYYRLAPGERARKLYVRDGFAGKERLLFDPESLSKNEPVGQRWSLDFFRAAPDGQHVVIAVAVGGSEQQVLRIIETNTARDLGLAIDRIAFADSTHWAADSKTFFYNRLPASPANTGQPVNRYLKTRVFRHQIGRAIEKDEEIFGPASPEVAWADIDIPEVSAMPDGKYYIGQIRHGDLTDISLYLADARRPIGKMGWLKIAGPSEQVTAWAIRNSEIYLLTHHKAPRFKIVRTLVANPDFAHAITIVPQGDTVIAEMAVAQDALYFRELFGGVDRLQRFIFSPNAFGQGRVEFVRLPFDLAIRQLITDIQRPGALVRLEGWTEPPQYSIVEARTGNLIATGLQPKPAVNFNDIDEVRLQVMTSDGVKVPISLIYRKSTTLNAENPTLLRAYGAYGISMLPTFSPAALAWLERGGILGTCHVRGGGEFGKEWHLAGQKLNKANSWRDLIACSEYLIKRRFTRPGKLAIQGGSAGGITVGRAMTERPDLFAAVVPAVGLLDALRAEFSPNGPPNIPEFGSVTTADGFKGLLAMSTLHHVKDDVRYPAVLLMHGINDPRVEVWHSLKMAARLRAATATVPDANPVLLRLDGDAGHGVGSSRAQRNSELADIYSFLLWRFGEADFQPLGAPAAH